MSESGSDRPEDLPEQWRSLAEDIREVLPGESHPSADMAERCAGELEEVQVIRQLDKKGDTDA